MKVRILLGVFGCLFAVISAASVNRGMNVMEMLYNMAPNLSSMTLEQVKNSIVAARQQDAKLDGFLSQPGIINYFNSIPSERWAMTWQEIRDRYASIRGSNAPSTYGLLKAIAGPSWTVTEEDFLNAVTALRQQAGQGSNVDTLHTQHSDSILGMLLGDINMSQ